MPREIHDDNLSSKKECGSRPSRTREVLGFNVGSARGSSLAPRSAAQCVQTPAGTCNYSMFHAPSQKPSMENHLMSAKDKIPSRDCCSYALSVAALAADPFSASKATHSTYVNRLPVGVAERMSREHLLSTNSAVASLLHSRPHTAESAAGHRRRGGGQQRKHTGDDESIETQVVSACTPRHSNNYGDRNPPAAPHSLHSHCVYSPETVLPPRPPQQNVSGDVSSAGRTWEATSVRPRPCSSDRMREYWKMPFAATNAIPQPSSVFTAAASAVARDSFIRQMYTKNGDPNSGLLMKPSSGDTAVDAPYRTLSHLKESTAACALPQQRPFGNLPTHNVRIVARPSSCTYRQRTPFEPIPSTNRAMMEKVRMNKLPEEAT